MNLFRNESGELDIGKIITTVIAVVVGGILIGALLPTAVTGNFRYVPNATTGYTYIGGANVTNWSLVGGLGATYDVIPIMIAVSGLFVFIAIVIKLTKG